MKVSLVTDEQIINTMVYLLREERVNLNTKISVALNHFSINEVSLNFCISEARVINVYEEKLGTTIMASEWHLKNNIKVKALLKNWFKGRQLNIVNTKFLETINLSSKDLEEYWEQNLIKK